ncbi:tetratricopeptide repeat protein, partial [Aeromonas fluvialis]|uniref:tetratricopeptide repeat protein n=1 Tax=Aeromonas fluvialis TaxID=591962 RepID=UPI001AD7F85D
MINKGEPAPVLAQVINNFGIDIANQPGRLKALFADLCNESGHKRQVRILLLLAEEGLVKKLVATSSLSERHILRAQLGASLHEDYGFDEQLANWGVDAWLAALWPQAAMNVVIEPDNNAAIFLSIEKQALQGNAAAQLLFGEMYANGQGVAQDDSQAVHWYRQAAEQGNADAQFNLGLSYTVGRGVAQDDGQAAHWYRQAAEQGHTAAQRNLGLSHTNGRGVAQDDGQAVYWYRKAAEKGNAAAQYSLGFMYAKGRGVAQDDSQAMRWYRQAAEQGHAAAQYNLGFMY